MKERGRWTVYVRKNGTLRKQYSIFPPRQAAQPLGLKSEPERETERWRDRKTKGQRLPINRNGKNSFIENTVSTEAQDIDTQHGVRERKPLYFNVGTSVA